MTHESHQTVWYQGGPGPTPVVRRPWISVYLPHSREELLQVSRSNPGCQLHTEHGPSITLLWSQVIYRLSADGQTSVSLQLSVSSETFGHKLSHLTGLFSFLIGLLLFDRRRLKHKQDASQKFLLQAIFSLAPSEHKLNTPMFTCYLDVHVQVFMFMIRKLFTIIRSKRASLEQNWLRRLTGSLLALLAHCSLLISDLLVWKWIYQQ